MVSVGLGVALVPRTAVVNKHPDVRVVSLGNSAPARRILAAYRPDRARTAAEIASVSQPALMHDSSTNALIRRFRRTNDARGSGGRE